MLFYMQLKNPFKHRHDFDHTCHCYQLCCKCGKHLWQIIRDSKKKFDGNGHLTHFKLDGRWHSIEIIKEVCKAQKLRFYSEETGELDYSMMVK